MTMSTIAPCHMPASRPRFPPLALRHRHSMGELAGTECFPAISPGLGTEEGHERDLRGLNGVNGVKRGRRREAQGSKTEREKEREKEREREREGKGKGRGRGREKGKHMNHDEGGLCNRKVYPNLSISA